MNGAGVVKAPLRSQYWPLPQGSTVQAAPAGGVMRSVREPSVSGSPVPGLPRSILVKMPAEAVLPV